MRKSKRHGRSARGQPGAPALRWGALEWSGVVICGLVFAGFVTSLALPAAHCASRGWCYGDEADAWMPAVFLAPLGLVSGIILLGLMSRRPGSARGSGQAQSSADA